ncbi:uncharacterized protein LOC121241570 [Juglans microcarpa x Juglans regia]|uniref:uncharacterized protein LOC121241570 n=1 Tax=Juglans microcarpa x Juglans regia TaxID=2249226 RepID=UPI001B7DFDA8|nr:uncharacterized protein LOC121241570 [Juglans microcarpa x Juglans regia]
MRCKKHTSDLSSTVGVCASCLSDRLLVLIAAQAQAQVLSQHQQLSRTQYRPADVSVGTQISDANLPPPPPPLVFPRSVSPYVSRRKSDDATRQHHHHDRHDRRFYSTPQVGPTYASSTFTSTTGSCRKKNSMFFLVSKLFGSRSEKLEPDPRISSKESCGPSSSTSSSSPSWFTTIFAGNRRKQSRLFVVDESTANVDRRPGRRANRGMSPVRTTDSDEDGDQPVPSSGYSSEAWRSPAFAVRRTRQGQSRNQSGIAFCLSPLVRASPNRHWNQKSLPPDITVSGDTRVPGKPNLKTAASFCKSRSRKLADLGKVGYNH